VEVGDEASAGNVAAVAFLRFAKFRLPVVSRFDRAKALSYRYETEAFAAAITDRYAVLSADSIYCWRGRTGIVACERALLRDNCEKVAGRAVCNSIRGLKDIAAKQ
jgi:hypothetical protein